MLLDTKARGALHTEQYSQVHAIPRNPDSLCEIL